jgi:hypothetical protein
MPIQFEPEAVRRQRSRAIQAAHADWAARQVAAGVDGPTPADRKEPSDYNQHVPDLEADGAALDEYWGKVADIVEATTA